MRFALLLILICGHSISSVQENTQPIASELTETTPIVNLPIWNKETLSLAKKLPIQSEGRVKPWNTHARILLIRFSGRTYIRLSDGTKISPIQWFLNTLFFPQVSKEYPVFIIQDNAVLEFFGLKTHEKKRDRYSYNELYPAREKIISQAETLKNIPPQKRTHIQDQILNLAENLQDFEEIFHYLDFSSAKFSIPPDCILASIFSNPSEISFLELVKNFHKVKKTLKESAQSLPKEKANKELTVLRNILMQVNELFVKAEHFAVVPPTDPTSDTWISPISSVIDVFDPEKESQPDTTLLELFTQVEDSKGNPQKFVSKFTAICNKLDEISKNRRETNKLSLEVLYYDLDFLFYSQWIFFLGVILTAFWWLRLNSKILLTSTTLINTIALALLITAITLRCIIRGRPPVTTLYETILFSTAVAVTLSLILVKLTKQDFLLSISSFLGLAGLFIANRYEMVEGTDTMPALIAVLDTNFWLTAHVTTIVIGYGAGLVASAISHIWIFGKILGWKKDTPEFYSSLSKTIYGVVCFCFVFSLIGTVLGGIWAQYSWGRFWGWDPKENGALLIVLWCLIIMHAKLAKILSNTGIVWTSIILGMVVAFSWWGVNLLGVGLHSYGFTKGVWNSLLTFWIIESIITILGLYLSFTQTTKTNQSLKM